MTWETLNLFGLINRFRRWRFRRRSKQGAVFGSSPTRGNRAYQILVAQVVERRLSFDTREQLSYDAIQRQLDELGKSWFEFSQDVKLQMRRQR